MAVTLPPVRRDVRSATATAAVGRRRSLTAWGFLAPSAAGFAVFTLIPIVGSIGLAFFVWPLLGERTFTGLDNFRTLFTSDPAFWRAMLNTTVFVVLYVPLNFVVSLGLALWMGPRIRGRGLYRVLFFLPAVTPMVANALVWRLLLQPGGLYDTVAQSWFGLGAQNPLGGPFSAMVCVVLMSVWQGFGYNMLVFAAGLEAIDRNLYEAAAIDGAGTLRRFWSITVPMLSPSMFFAAVMTLITSFQVFAQPYILTGGGPGNATQTTVMLMYQSGFQFFQLGTASAIATVLLLLIVLVTGLQFLGQRRWVHYDH